MSEFTAIADRFETELTEQVIPFWLNHGIDREYGGFFNFLDRDGSVYDGAKQMWLQWRAVYMFAALYHAGYRNPAFLEAAVAGFRFLREHARKPDGSYWFLLRRDGAPMAAAAGGAEIFSESFAAIAGAELYAVTGEEVFRREALSCLEIYLRNIRRSETVADAPGARRWRQFGHYMIGLNVLAIFKRALGGHDFDAMLTGMLDAVWTFRHPEYGIIFERTTVGGDFDLESQDGRFTNPGHALEGMWFVLEQRRPEDREKALECCRATLRRGWDEEQRGIYYFRDIRGLPLLRSDCMLKAWWPQFEALNAAAAAYEAGRDDFFLDCFRKIDRYIQQNLRDPDGPEYFPYAPVDGRRSHTFKGGMWKGFFHVPRALLSLTQTFRRMA